MSTLNDLKCRALRQQGFQGSLDDMLISFYKERGVDGEYMWLANILNKTGSLNDLRYEYLILQGFTGSHNDMLLSSLSANQYFNTFTPISLFSAGEQGAWYDPSDFSTMFQDSAGTTPVTAVEQPVGLMRDKRIQQSWIDVTGAVWTKTAGDGVVTVSGNQITVTGATTPTAVTRTAGSMPFTAGTARLIIRADWTTATGVQSWLRGVPLVLTNGVTQTRIAALNNSNLERLEVVTGTVTFTILGFDYWAGNHATQTTATSRPVLSARVNLLTKTEQFDDAVWTKDGATVSANSITAPNGTLTADKLIESATTAEHRVFSNQVGIGTVGMTWAIYAKAAERSWIAIRGDTGLRAANFNLASGTLGTSTANVTATISSVGDGWYFCSMTAAGAAANERAAFNIGNTDTGTGIGYTYTGDGTSGIYIWGADLRVANDGVNIPAYQRVNTSTDYDTTGFPMYLRFDGVDDGMVTNSINFTSTDKMTVFAGVRKLSDATAGIVVELSASVGNGRFLISAPGGSGAPNYGISSAGTIQSGAVTSSVYQSPITNTITGIGNISGDSAILRINGTQAASSMADQGTGNYGNYPLYIGRRGGTTLPLNGRLYSLIVRGAQSSAGQIASAETWVNSKTGAY